MNHYYENKLTLITGGSSGIGLALAKEITARGGNVAILARHADALEQAAAEIAVCKVNADQKVYTLPADIVDYEALSVVLTKFKAEVGVPDIVINSAGVAHPGRFTALPLEIFHWMMDVNYFGTVNVLKLLLPEIQERHSGTVVNISSMAGFIGVYGYSAYGASKFAITGFSDVLRSELKPYGVQVSVVFPPDTDTPQLKYESQFKPFITKEVAGSASLMPADAVAKETLDAVAKGKYIILPGSEGKLMFVAQNLLGRGLYPVMDMMVNSAIKKLRFGK
ncbi:MAG: SDR family oxidoreductase [Anaerolineaceae bacterium]|nr:SDR family oxidoreductase [Anaerolineaceae bacterium]